MTKIYIYRLIPVENKSDGTNNNDENKNKGMIKQIGFITDPKDFKDEEFEIVDQDNKEMTKINDYINIKFKKSSITDAYIQKNNKLPVMYASVIYSKPFLTGVLMEMVVYFEFDTKKIKSAKQLLETEIKGKFVTEISINNSIETLRMENFTTYEETAKDMCKLLKTDVMIEIINELMKERDEERRKKFGSPADFKIPKVTYKFDDVVKKYEEGMNIDEILKTIEKKE
jgi:hypothetical protein